MGGTIVFGTACSTKAMYVNIFAWHMICLERVPCKVHEGLSGHIHDGARVFVARIGGVCLMRLAIDQGVCSNFDFSWQRLEAVQATGVISNQSTHRQQMQ